MPELTTGKYSEIILILWNNIRALGILLLFIASYDLARPQDAQAWGGKPFRPKSEAIDLRPFLSQGTPSDDPRVYLVDDKVNYEIEVSKPNWLIPGENLPISVVPMKSNNNVSITFHQGRLFLAFRSGPNHFANKKTLMYIISSDDGRSWRYEGVFFENADIREPHLVSYQGKLRFYYFMAGSNPFSFKPQKVQAYEYQSPGNWSGPDLILDKGEVPWDMKVRDGKLWLSSYQGSHYRIFGASKVELNFQTSLDGLNFQPVGEIGKAVYRGGVSEAAFEFDELGNLWGVTRNEDGDQTGFGSHVVYAQAGDLGHWEFPATSSPHAYMSPKIFRHGKELYLIARRQTGKKPFGRAGEVWGMPVRRLVNWLGFSLTSKTTALFRIDQEKRQVLHVMDLPGAGDTALPSIHRLDAHNFLLANYTSRTDRPKTPWLGGQLKQTHIYLLQLSFKPQ